MASKALCVAILVGGLCHVLAAPTFNSTHYTRATPQPTSLCLRQENIDPPSQLRINEADALLLDTSSQALSTTFAIPEGNQYPFSFSYITPPVSNPTVEQTTTVTITMEEPTTITVPAEPKTITEFITITSSSSSLRPPAPSRSPLDNDMGPAKAVWVAPGNMSDLSSFHVSKYAGGKQNMKVVTGIPAKASATSKAAIAAAAAAVAADPSLPQWDNASAALQLFFPENSIDPANEPQGGAEFYAAPIDISDARNVTFQYSVFFPKDFDWVLAGKLPGLYGGHTGCSGGNAALDCFSTRLMWRQNGAGELYLVCAFRLATC